MAASRPAVQPLFHIVLHEPEIPNNTGNIGRTCIATGCALHLIHPLGFDTSEKALRRAGLDYWPRVDVRHHADWEEYVAWRHSSPSCEEEDQDTGRRPVPPTLWLTSGKTGRPIWEADFHPGDHIVFGRETRGLPPALIEAHRERTLTLPMVAGERGLNVATAVCAVIYEGMRQCVERGEVAIDDL